MQCKPDVAVAAILLIVAAALSASGSTQAGATAQANSAAPSQSFEVASIKPSEGQVAGKMRVSIEMSPGGRFTASGVTLKLLIQQAYDIRDYQISGGPGWIATEQYDINAKAENPDADRAQVKAMLQSLLAERFQLKFQRETKQLPVYALVVAKGGHKLRLSEIQPEKESVPTGAVKAGEAPPGGAAGRSAGATMRMGRGQLNAQAVPITALTNMLAQQLGRPVLDHTDLKGNYDINLEWTPDETQRAVAIGHGTGAPPASETSGPSIFTAVQEQLGLKLESQRGPVDTFVIVSVEKPSKN